MTDLPVMIASSHPVPGMDDGDYTAMFVAERSTFSVSGVMTAMDVPITSAVVRDGVLYFEGVAVLR